MKKHKKNKNFDPFEPLDEYEKDLKEALESGVEFEEDPNFEETKKMLMQAAKNHRLANASKPVTARIKYNDLAKLKAKAQSAGMRYQTLLSVLIHNYVEGKIPLSI